MPAYTYIIKTYATRDHLSSLDRCFFCGLNTLHPTVSFHSKPCSVNNPLGSYSLFKFHNDWLHSHPVQTAADSSIPLLSCVLRFKLPTTRNFHSRLVSRPCFTS
uniref:Uncharacterized protein n=1 Tax=Apteryx owenii TaxID=8824 RepID=A0A8B9PKD9_APTOW